MAFEETGQLNKNELWADAIARCLSFSETAKKTGLPCIMASDLDKMAEMDYAERISFVFGKFVSKMPDDAVKSIESAFSDFDEDPLPMIKLDDGLFVAECNHGFSGCADDLTFAALPGIVRSMRKARGCDDGFYFPVAVKSGAIAGCVLSGVSDDFPIFYPEREMPELQKRLLSEKFPQAYAYRGDYFATEKCVREAAGKYGKLARKAIMLSLDCAGAVILRIACFISAYVDIFYAEECTDGAEINFFVPAGYGELAGAGLYAKQMGLPITITAVGIEGKNTPEGGLIQPYEDVKVFAEDYFDEYGYVADMETIACMAAAEQKIDSADGECVAVALSADNAFNYADEILDLLGEKKGKTMINSLKKLENATALPLSEAFYDAASKEIRREKTATDQEIEKIITDYVTSR